jgi:hypothetical protein
MTAEVADQPGPLAKGIGRMAEMRAAGGPYRVACSMKRPYLGSWAWGAWPCEVIRWRRTRVDVLVRIGTGVDERTVHVDRLRLDRPKSNPSAGGAA